MLLPFDTGKDLLNRMLPMIPHAPPGEMLARCVLFLVRMHHKQILVHRGIFTTLSELDRALAARLTTEQALLGYNLAALRCMRLFGNGGFVRRNKEQAVDASTTGKKKRGDRL